MKTYADTLLLVIVPVFPAFPVGLLLDLAGGAEFTKPLGLLVRVLLPSQINLRWSRPAVLWLIEVVIGLE